MNKEVEITISEMQLNGTTAIRIMKCLKEHEPEIWHKLKETLKQKLPIHDVVISEAELCDNPNCEDGIVDYDYYKNPIYCQVCDKHN
jgi:hypothetical protein